MKVTTRKDQVDFPKKTQNNASQPNVYVVIVNDEVREMSTRKCKKNYSKNSRLRSLLSKA